MQIFQHEMTCTTKIVSLAQKINLPA